MSKPTEATVTADDPWARVLVVKPDLILKKKTTTTSTTTTTTFINDLRTAVDTRVIAPVIRHPTTTTTTFINDLRTAVDPRVIAPVIRPHTKSPPPGTNFSVSPNSTESAYELYLCAPYPQCNPIGCGDPTVAPIDCEQCNAAATGASIFGMLLMSALIIIANLLVIRVILRTPALRRRHGYIKLSMATSDLLVGVFVIPAAVANMAMVLYFPYLSGDDVTTTSYDFESHFYDLTQYNTTTSIIFGTIAVISVTSSLYNLLLLSFDRFLAIARPLKHRAGKFYNKKSLWLSISAVWIFGIVLSIVPAFFPSNFFYSMDLTTFLYIQRVQAPESIADNRFEFAPYYITVVIGGPYVLTVVLNILTMIFTWRSLRLRKRMSSRRKPRQQPPGKSNVEKKCERNRRMQMLKNAYPESMMDEESGSTFKSIFKKATPRHKDKRSRDVSGPSSGDPKEKESWLVWWHSDDNLPEGNTSASNNISSDSSDRSHSQSPRFQRTRDQLHIVRDKLNPANVSRRVKDFNEQHKTHVQVFKMIIAMVIAFTLCLLPYVIVVGQVSAGSLDCSNIAVPFSFAMYMLLMNSGVNFIVYNLWHPEFRRHMMKMMRNDYSRTHNWTRAASSLFVTSHKGRASSTTRDSYITPTNTTQDVLDGPSK